MVRLKILFYTLSKEKTNYFYFEEERTSKQSESFQMLQHLSLIILLTISSFMVRKNSIVEIFFCEILSFLLELVFPNLGFQFFMKFN